MELISREAAIAYSISGMTREIDGDKWIRVSEVRESIKTMPSTQPERMKGKWNWDFADNGWADWTCSICGWKKNTDVHVNLGYKYCPNCGARMEEVTG